MNSYVWPFILPLPSSATFLPCKQRRVFFFSKLKCETIKKENSVHVFKNTGFPPKYVRFEYISRLKGKYEKAEAEYDLYFIRRNKMFFVLNIGGGAEFFAMQRNKKLHI